MLRPWILAAAFLHAISCSCPSGFTLQWNGICTKLEEDGLIHPMEYLKGDALNICQYIGAYPVMIRTQEEQNYWANIAMQHKFPIALGLRCNIETKEYEWADGSRVDYKPSDTTISISKDCHADDYSWAMKPSGDWETYTSRNNAAWVIYCMVRLPPRVSPEGGCGDFTGNGGDCYQIGKTAESWAEAQAVCKSFGGNLATIHSEQENSHIRRLAFSTGQVNGIHIGATNNGKNDNISWIDGSELDYNNFMPANDIEPSCGNSVYTEGEVIYSPGFPSTASVPCDFFLQVDSDKIVEVEIVLLEANSCCDRLIISEDILGGSVIANLTGEVASGTKYRTTSSNNMRVSWQPNGGVNVRGMMITFRGVPK